LQRHVDYIHYNPVKHGHVSRVSDWPHSSFRLCRAWSPAVGLGWRRDGRARRVRRMIGKRVRKTDGLSVSLRRRVGKGAPAYVPRIKTGKAPIARRRRA
jgi:hypothetical protein